MARKYKRDSRGQFAGGSGGGGGRTNSRGKVSKPGKARRAASSFGRAVKRNPILATGLVIGAATAVGNNSANRSDRRLAQFVNSHL